MGSNSLQFIYYVNADVLPLAVGGVFAVLIVVTVLTLIIRSWNENL